MSLFSLAQKVVADGPAELGPERSTKTDENNEFRFVSVRGSKLSSRVYATVMAPESLYNGGSAEFITGGDCDWPGMTTLDFAAWQRRLET
jgi:hypothetical protein